jgi:hypothetical protein
VNDFMTLLLAQAPPITPDEGVGLAERMTKGGVPVIALCVAIAATIGVVYLFQKLLAKSEEFKELERHYRKTIEDKATVDKVDYEKRLVDAKGEAKERASEIDKLMRERMASDRESDATLAKAVLALEGNTKQLDQVGKLLEEIKSLNLRVTMALERK